MRPNALLIVNANSRRGAAGMDGILSTLKQGSIEVIRASPEGPEQIADAIHQHRSTIDRVIVGGGDGSLNAALPAVLNSGLPMGVLPLGTANDFARSLGLSLDVERASRVILAGHVRHVDVGEVNGRYFLNAAHVGFAVEVARGSGMAAKKWLGPLAYPIAAWRAFRARRSFSVRIEGPDECRRLRAIQVTVGNGRFYGGGIPVATGAAIDDGLLDLYAIPTRKGSALLAMVPVLTSGRTHGHAHIVTMRGTHFEVTTRRPKTVAVDGEEAFKAKPVRFKVHPAALPVYAPPP